MQDEFNDGTTETGAAPWRQLRASLEPTVPHVAIVWAASPERVGEVAAVSKASVIGRGPARAEDPAPRLRFVRQRPGSNLPTPALEPKRISRLQLSLAPSGGQSLAFQRLGQCRLFHNGMLSDSGIAREGDLLTLEDAFTFLVQQRPKLLPAAWDAAQYRATPFGYPDPFGMIGESPYAWEMRARIATLAQGSDPILVVGASGVGKELVARAVHALSPAATGKLVSRNAATIPDSLIDAELFGSQRNYPNPGAPERSGLIGEADGGTLFLDEIGELPAAQQAHLLRFLDSGEYHRLGDARNRVARLRLLAATNRDPTGLKHDFLARFAKRVDVQGFDARRPDVPLFISAIVRDIAETVPAHDRFLHVCKNDDGTETRHARLHPALLERLLSHEYTLGFRELRRLVMLAIEYSAGDHLVESPALERELKVASTGEPGAVEIERALAACQGNVTQAARALKLPSRFALYRLIKRLGISVDQ